MKTKKQSMKFQLDSNILAFSHKGGLSHEGCRKYNGSDIFLTVSRINRDDNNIVKQNLHLSVFIRIAIKGLRLLF